MAIFKRGRVYWYHFIFNGVHVQQSSKQGNPRVARQLEAAHRTSLAKGEAGFRDRKTAPSLGDFIVNRFEPWAKAQFETSSPKTWRDWYRCNLRVLVGFSALSAKRLDQLTSEDVAGFAADRRARGLQVSTVNSSLRVLRRVFRKASEWGAYDGPMPRIEMMRGEQHRERVLSRNEEARYLAACDEQLLGVATVLADTGMRPEECYRLLWESVSWTNGRSGSIQITHGKSPAARRVLPMTPRVRSVIEMMWRQQGRPPEGWIFPANTRSGHVEPSTFKKRHARVFRDLTNEAATANQPSIRPFVFYCFRHTFATRLGESGIDAWTLCRIMGWSNVSMSSRYVHPSNEAVLRAVERLQESASSNPPALPQYQ